MRFTTLAMLDDQALTDAFNAVYEKYVVPFRLTLGQMRLHITANAISLEHSPLLLNETGGLVGLAALGVRGDRGWVGGVGLTLPARFTRFAVAPKGTTFLIGCCGGAHD